MNYLWIFDKEIKENDNAVITDSFRLSHLKETLKSAKSDQLKIILLGKGVGNATIRSISDEEICLSNLILSPGQERTINLLVGLSRPQTMKKVLEVASVFPVKKLYLHRTELGEKSYETSKVFEEDQPKKHLLQGLSQSGRFHTLPEVEVCKYIPFSKVDDNKNKIIFHPKSTISLKSFEHSDLALAIGSERGYTARELKQFNDHGFKNCWLSDSILRVETALTSALSGIELLSF